MRGRLLPGLPEPAGTALVPVELTALAGMATLAVDRAFAARLAGRVAGGAGPTGAAGPLSEAERGVVELAILGALDALAAETEIEAALAPRLALRGGTPVRPICVELTVSAAGTRGRAFLFLPEAALRALPRASQLSPALEDVPVRRIGPERAGWRSTRASSRRSSRGTCSSSIPPPANPPRSTSRAVYPRGAGWPAIHSRWRR